MAFYDSAHKAYNVLSWEFLIDLYFVFDVLLNFCTGSAHRGHGSGRGSRSEPSYITNKHEILGHLEGPRTSNKRLNRCFPDAMDFS